MASLNKNPLLEEIKHELHELEAQVKSGRKELNKAYKSRNEKFSGLIKNVHNYISEVEKAGGEKARELESDSKYLLDTLESDFDFSYTDFEEKPQNLKSALHDFEVSLKNFYKELNEKTGYAKKKLENEWKANLKKLKSEIQNVKKSEENLEEWKVNRLEEMKSLKEKIDQRVHRSKDKIDQFNLELTEAYDHLKAALKNLK